MYRLQGRGYTHIQTGWVDRAVVVCEKKREKGYVSNVQQEVLVEKKACLAKPGPSTKLKSKQAKTC